MHRRLPRCDPRRFQKKETKFSGKHTSAKHTQGRHLFGTHTPKFICETLCSRYTNVVSRSRTAYHSQVFRSPNLLNGEQLTCSKAACEGGGTVLRFNCPKKMESLLYLSWFVQSQLFRESEWTSPGNSSMLDIWTKCPDQMHISWFLLWHVYL